VTPSLHLDDTGGSGLPVVFQHGLLGDAAQPAEVFPQAASFRRLTLEMRGHGRSEAGDTAAFSIAAFADDLIAVIERSRLAPLVVGGISMGAAIAMRVAVLRPGLVRGLIIARPAWSTAPAPGNMRPNAEVGELLRRYPAAQAQGIFEASATAQRLAREAPDNLASLQGFFSRTPRDVTAALLCAISADGPGVSAAQLRAVAVPTLVIAHARDEVHPLGLARQLAGIIPTARLVEITPKAVDRQRYAADFRNALAHFLKEFL
jgi:pimeloyl-ACP methyl ester carboxylesterase